MILHLHSIDPRARAKIAGIVYNREGLFYPGSEERIETKMAAFTIESARSEQSSGNKGTVSTIRRKHYGLQYFF